MNVKALNENSNRETSEKSNKKKDEKKNSWTMTIANCNIGNGIENG